MIAQLSDRPRSDAPFATVASADTADHLKVNGWVRLLREWDRTDLVSRDTVAHDIYLDFRGRVTAMTIGELRKRGHVNHEEVEDVSQETFAALLAHIHNDPARFATRLSKYGFGGLVRLFQKIVAQQVSRRAQANARAGQLDPLGSMDDWASRDDSESGLQAATNSIWIRQALAHLEADERALLVRRYLQGMGFQAIADEVGTTVAAAKMRLSRLLKELRASLQPQEA